jgi:UDP-glucuronate 4-epimerase
MKYLVTGAAGFIGFHLSKILLEKGETVVGIDNLNDYYDVHLKYARLNELGVEQTDFEYNRAVKSSKYSDFQFVKVDIADKNTLNGLFESNEFDFVCNFAAQAGIMYSTLNPDAYIHSNIKGFLNILDCCKNHNCKLIYASSSSVYGNNLKLPFLETDEIKTPKNLYAKTKIQNEQLAQIYSDHFGLQAVGLRLFSVYGAFGRPDMAYIIFTQSILNHLPINIYGNGTMKRDYTYVSDVVIAIEKIIAYSVENKLYNDIFNIGNSNPVSLLELVEKLENQLNIKAIRNYLPMRAEEIETTFADVSKLFNSIGYKPETNIDEGLSKFVKWCKITHYNKREHIQLNSINN